LLGSGEPIDYFRLPSTYPTEQIFLTKYYPELAMLRFVVLLFGLTGVAFTALVGALYLFPQVLINVIKDSPVDKTLAEDLIKIVAASPMGTTHGDTGVFLMAAAGYGFLGTMLGFFRCGWQGALLMLVPVTCTTIMNYHSAIFVVPLFLAGLASFGVFPLPLNAPKESDADDEEPEAEVKSKKPKRKVDDED
jgi:hypothetical protein